MLTKILFRLTKEPTFQHISRVEMLHTIQKFNLELDNLLINHFNSQDILFILEGMISKVTTNETLIKSFLWNLIKEIFKKFLQDVNIEDIFIRERAKHLGRDKTIDEFFERMSRASTFRLTFNPIINAFGWESTAQGIWYWSNMLDKWYAYLKLKLYGNINKRIM